MYPFNQVKETESGFVQEIDNTPSNERYSFYHPVGNFEEVQADGTRINKIKGSDYEIIAEDKQLELTSKSKKKINDCRDYLDKKMEQSDAPIYGVNTGFGALCNHKITNKDLRTLQKNLVLSHACGTGEEVPEKVEMDFYYIRNRSTALDLNIIWHTFFTVFKSKGISH